MQIKHHGHKNVIVNLAENEEKDRMENESVQHTFRRLPLIRKNKKQKKVSEIEEKDKTIKPGIERRSLSIVTSLIQPNDIC